MYVELEVTSGHPEKQQHMAKRARQTWVQILDPLLTSYVTS